jgi:hypothetical protein
MLFVHDAPLAVDLTQAHRQSELERFASAIRVDADAVSNCHGEGNVVAAGDFDVVKVKDDRLLTRGKKFLLSSHIGVEAAR